jgi:hypothetical protein
MGHSYWDMMCPDEVEHRKENNQINGKNLERGKLYLTSNGELVYCGRLSNSDLPETIHIFSLPKDPNKQNFEVYSHSLKYSGVEAILVEDRFITPRDKRINFESAKESVLGYSLDIANVKYALAKYQESLRGLGGAGI